MDLCISKPYYSRVSCIWQFPIAMYLCGLPVSIEGFAFVGSCESLPALNPLSPVPSSSAYCVNSPTPAPPRANQGPGPGSVAGVGMCLMMPTFL